MDRSRTPPSQKRGSSGHGQTTDRREAILEFLAEKLPADQTKQADYLADALLRAGTRYDRYAAKDNQIKWKNYTARRNRFDKITRSIQAVVKEMGELDPISFDDLSTRVDRDKLESLMGSLVILGKATGELAAQVQKSGPPKDLAEERWILELADIYENAFSERPSVWRSPDGRRMSPFYRLLELSLPETFFRHGSLSRRQIDRVLSQRRPVSEKLTHKQRDDQTSSDPLLELSEPFRHASEEQLPELREGLKVVCLDLLRKNYPDVPEEILREQSSKLVEQVEARGRGDGPSEKG
jgi:hypothetical protein